ncbi:MAG: hypothetical protein KAS82_04645 [Bacteroidales bacterium]|nr:hypothetical protein [Bacteroidales bacterium]
MLILLFTRCERNDPVDITDNAFLTALIEQGVDTDGDGLISNIEAEAVTHLELYNKNISDLSGIERFINLVLMGCGNNALSRLDVSNSRFLQLLICGDNKLTTLDVSMNAALQYLSCSSNQLTLLDLSNITRLHSLYCGDNLLSSLDISNNTYMGWLDITNMPSLYEVCVWTLPFPPERMHVDRTGSPNVYFTTECSN